MGVEIAGRAVRPITFACILILLGACTPICGIGAKFALSNARVDAQFDCPYPSDLRPYDVHGSIDASNTTSSTVKIQSITEEDVLVNTVGNWTGQKGVKAGGPITNYQPKSVGSGNDATIKFSVPFECTNSGGTTKTYGDFSFKFKVATSAGTYTLDAGNRHRLNLALS